MADKKPEVKHHDYAKLAKPNLDDLVKHIQETSYTDIADSFKDYDNFMHEDHRDHVLANVLMPSFDEFYSTAKKELDSTFKTKDGKPDAGAKVYNKNKELKKILAKSMLSYLKKSRPELHKQLMKTVKEDKLDEYYDLIAHQMDTHVLGLDPQKGGLYSGLAERYAKSDEMTVNKMKVELNKLRDTTTSRSWQYLAGKKTQTTVGKYEPFAVANYLKDKLIAPDTSGYQLHKEKEFLMQDMGDLMQVYHGVTKNQWADNEGKAVDPKSYYVTKKAKKAK